MRDDGAFGQLMDADWNLVYVTDELRRTFGGGELAEFAMGRTVFGSESVAAALRWRFGANSHENQRRGIGGLAIGLLAVCFPLTLGSGKAQLPEMIAQAEDLGVWVLLGVVGAKILAMAISLGTGFIGGPVMPTLFIGGAAGVATHVIVPDLPIALTLSCLLVAVPGASIKAPFSMALLAALTVGVEPTSVAPAGVAVLTAYLLTAGLGLFVSILPGKTDDPDDSANVSYQEQLFELRDTRMPRKR